MGREKCERLSFNHGGKKSIFIPVVTRTRFCFGFFFLEFPQPPGGVMTRRIYKTDYNSGKRFRALWLAALPVISSAIHLRATPKSRKLQAKWLPSLLPQQISQNMKEAVHEEGDEIRWIFFCLQTQLKSCVTLFSWHVHKQAQKVT